MAMREKGGMRGHDRCMAHRKSVIPGLRLLPCPFCGGQPEIVWTHSGTDWVQCTVCNAEIHPPKCPHNAEHAAAIWNRRWLGEKSAPYIDDNTFMT